MGSIAMSARQTVVALSFLAFSTAAATAGPAADACAALAASPFEAGLESIGVRNDLVDADAAITACEAAHAAEPDSTAVDAWLARAYLIGGRSEDAYASALPAADAGNPLAQVIVANVLLERDPNDPAAIPLYEAALAAGYAPAANPLGIAYRDGEGGLTQSYEKAAEILAIAADAGYAEAINNLGLLYSYGTGVPLDFDKANAMFLQAWEKGEVWGANNLAYGYQFGEGFEIDLKKAAEWYQKAVDAGLPQAGVNLADLYLDGRGVVINYKRALTLAEGAAEAGDPGGSYVLGKIFERGLGVPANVDRAIELYKLAADGGNTNAINALKRLGVTQ